MWLPPRTAHRCWPQRSDYGWHRGACSSCELLSSWLPCRSLFHARVLSDVLTYPRTLIDHVAIVNINVRSYVNTYAGTWDYTSIRTDLIPLKPRPAGARHRRTRAGRRPAPGPRPVTAIIMPARRSRRRGLRFEHVHVRSRRQNGGPRAAPAGVVCRRARPSLSRRVHFPFCMIGRARQLALSPPS